MESIKNITKLEVPNLQKNIPNNEMQCRLTLLPSSLLPGKTPKLMLLLLFPNGKFQLRFFFQVIN
jgi:hypothetical protein